MRTPGATVRARERHVGRIHSPEQVTPTERPPFSSPKCPSSARSIHFTLLSCPSFGGHRIVIGVYISQSLFTLPSTACREYIPSTGHTWPVSLDRYPTRVQTKTRSLDDTLPAPGLTVHFTPLPDLASTTSHMDTEKTLSCSSDGLTPVVIR